MLLAGAFKANVTPPYNACICGGFAEMRLNNILDDIYVHALILDDGSREFAIVSIDHCLLYDQIFYGRVLQTIEEGTGLTQEQVMIACTHTHSGPVTYNEKPEIFGEAAEDYVQHFLKSLVSAINMARLRKKPVKLGVGKGKNENHVFNRRLKKPDGSIVMNWVEFDFIQDGIPSGPVDPEMLVARFDDDSGKPVAMIVNYGNHNNAALNGISSDISGHMSEILGQLYGKEMVVIFLTGACGNTNWINHKDVHRFDADCHKKIGTGLAGTVLEIMGILEYVEADGIKFAHEILEVVDRPYCDYDDHEDGTFGHSPDAKIFFRVYHEEKEEYKNAPLRLNKVDIHALAIGDSFAVASNPSELFCDFGIEIKQKSPVKYTMIAELTNGYAGYVPTKKAFEEGGYEVRKTRIGSYLDIDAGDRIVDSSLRLLEAVSGKRPEDITCYGTRNG